MLSMFEEMPSFSYVKNSFTEANISIDKTAHVIAKNWENLDAVVYVVVFLKKSGCLTEQNFLLAMQNFTAKIRNIEFIRNKIHKTGDRIEFPIGNIILKSLEEIEVLVNAVKNLDSIGLFNQKYFDLCMQNITHSPYISDALVGLKLTNLLTPENQELIEQNPQNASDIGAAFYAIYKYQKKLLNPKNCNLIMQNIKDAKGIKEAIFYLLEKKILTQDTLNLVLNNPKYAANFVAFVKKYNINVTMENLSKLYKSGIHKDGSLAHKCLGYFWSTRPQITREELATLPEEVASLLPY